jgi:hypothetical protein
MINSIAANFHWLAGAADDRNAGSATAPDAQGCAPNSHQSAANRRHREGVKATLRRVVMMRIPYDVFVESNGQFHRWSSPVRRQTPAIAVFRSAIFVGRAPASAHGASI